MRQAPSKKPLVDCTRGRNNQCNYWLDSYWTRSTGKKIWFVSSLRKNHVRSVYIIIVIIALGDWVHFAISRRRDWGVVGGIGRCTTLSPWFQNDLPRRQTNRATAERCSFFSGPFPAFGLDRFDPPPWSRWLIIIDWTFWLFWNFTGADFHTGKSSTPSRPRNLRSYLLLFVI